MLTSSQVSDATKLMQKSYKIAIPFPDPKPDENAAYKFEYACPSDINVVGSYVLKTMTRGEDTLLSVDLVVTMPASIFQEKDYLNYRYFYKRAYFIACIAAGIRESVGKEYEMVFDTLNGNSLQPILVIKPGKGTYLVAFFLWIKFLTTYRIRCRRLCSFEMSNTHHSCCP